MRPANVQPFFTGPRRANLERRRAQVEQWIAEESSPIHEVELIQQRLDIDAQLAQIDQAARLPELEEAFVKVAAAWAKRPPQERVRHPPRVM